MINLKHQDRMFEDDFKSDEEFRNYCDHRVSEIEDYYNDLSKKLSEKEESIENTKPRQDWDEKVQSALNEINNFKNNAQDKKGDI